MRRWTAGSSYELAGIKVAIYPGTKPCRCHGVPIPGDLVAMWRTPDGWRAIPMSFGQFLADFFAENEQVSADHHGHWRFNGDTYYLKSLHEAAAKGWQVPAEKTRRQQQAIRDGSAQRGSGGNGDGRAQATPARKGPTE